MQRLCMWSSKYNENRMGEFTIHANGFYLSLEDINAGCKPEIALVPYLINIDGNTCHHVHNIVKKFTGAFDNYIESMFHQI